MSLLLLIAVYLLTVWWTYRLIRRAYRVPANDLVGDVVALLVAVPAAAVILLAASLVYTACAAFVGAP